MRRFLKTLVAAASIALVAGCSSGSSDPGTAPVIYNLVAFPVEFKTGAGGGAVSLTLMFSFEDPDGDVARYRMTGPEGVVEKPVAPPADGQLQGSVSIPAVISTATAGARAYTIELIDEEDNVSNPLTFVATVK
jgi:hypothetical protein